MKVSPMDAHILAIDDDPAIRKLVCDYLGGNDLRVTAVASGAEMARVLGQHAIDLVMLDLRLAGEDGMELARKLREERATPIIIVSGKHDEADRIMGLELGADDYVMKPFRPRARRCWHAATSGAPTALLAGSSTSAAAG